MKYSLLSLAALILTLSSAQADSGQSVTFTSGDSSWTLAGNSFSTDADGVSTLNTDLPAFVSNLAADSALPSSLDLTGGGWVFNNATNPSGTVVIADSGVSSGVTLADPFVAYSYFFINSTGTSQPFSMQFTSNFPDTTFDSSLAKASLGLSLTDGSPPDPNENESTISNVTQTAVLGEAAVAGGSFSQSVPVPVTIGPVNLSATDGQTTPYNKNLAYTTGPSGGPYNELVVTVSGTYSANAVLGVSGRVDVVPEPSTFALFAMGAFAGLVFHWRRISYRLS